MKVRKTKDLKSVLKKKGFVLDPQKDHHNFYYLEIDGVRQPIYIYLSHGVNEYGTDLMALIKRQLKFNSTQKAEDFFDCPLSAQGYEKMLKENNCV